MAATFAGRVEVDVSKKWDRRGVSAPVALVVAAVLGGGLFAYLALFSKPGVDATKEGDQIVAALNNYFADTTAYPDTLGGIMPRYLAKVPLPPDSAVTDWVYAPNPAGREFTLAYNHPGARGVTYTSATQQWERDDQ